MLLDINKIKVSDRIRKDFGNIQELADDIKENGLINPPVVTPDTFELIAGERRLRAMQLLGYQQVEVRAMAVKDALHQLKIEISENENRKDFNFNEKIQWAKLLADEYKKEGEKNILLGLPLDQNLSRVDTNKRVAKETGFESKETYRQAKYIAANATEEIIQKLDEGQLSINKAYATLKADKAKLQKENTELKLQTSAINNLNNQIKQNEIEQTRLKKRISELVQQGTKTKTITQEVDKPKTLVRIEQLQKDLQSKNVYSQKLYSDLIEANKMLKTVMGESTNWHLTSHCSEITLKMINFIKEMAKYDYLAESFNEIPLATKKEYMRNISAVRRWADNILTVIEKEEEIIEFGGEIIYEKNI